MKNGTHIGRIALGCLLLYLVVSMPGCHGLRSRYGLLFREDLSAELWRFPDGVNPAMANPVMLADSESSCIETDSGSETLCTEATCPEATCPETLLCRRPLCMSCLGRRDTVEAAEPVAPPPAITPRFFPVPTQPVFTPRSDLNHLNPYAQQRMPCSATEIPTPCETSPETILPVPGMPQNPVPDKSQPQPIPEILPSPTPETSGVDPSAPSLLPIPRSHWTFTPRSAPVENRDKVHELIASGAQRVK